jgi:hypothetical protein
MQSAREQGIRNFPDLVIIASAALFAPADLASALDWSQYRGSNQDGISNDRIISTWENAASTALWKVPLGTR